MSIPHTCEISPRTSCLRCAIDSKYDSVLGPSAPPSRGPAYTATTPCALSQLVCAQCHCVVNGVFISEGIVQIGAACTVTTKTVINGTLCSHCGQRGRTTSGDTKPTDVELFDATHTHCAHGHAVTNEPECGKCNPCSMCPRPRSWVLERHFDGSGYSEADFCDVHGHDFIQADTVFANRTDAPSSYTLKVIDPSVETALVVDNLRQRMMDHLLQVAKCDACDDIRPTHWVGKSCSHKPDDAPPCTGTYRTALFNRLAKVQP